MGKKDPDEEVTELQVPEPNFKSHPGVLPAPQRLTEPCHWNGCRRTAVRECRITSLCNIRHGVLCFFNYKIKSA
jgi:hypothetical protein